MANIIKIKDKICELEQKQDSLTGFKKKKNKKEIDKLYKKLKNGNNNKRNI